MALDRDVRALETAVMFSRAPMATGGPVSLQRMRQRRGRSTAGFFDVFKKAAQIAVGNIPGIGPIAQAVLSGGGRGGQRTDLLPIAVQQPLAQPLSVAASPAGCPPGFKIVRGRCVATGLGGALERLIPGGETGVLGLEFGDAVMGAFGIPALEPAQVGTITRRDGTVAPILRCPPGAVLGTDELCYTKGTISRQNRKWKPAAKPPISAADWRATRRFASVQKRIKKVASAGGFSCLPKGSRRSSVPSHAHVTRVRAVKK